MGTEMAENCLKIKKYNQKKNKFEVFQFIKMEKEHARTSPDQQKKKKTMYQKMPKWAQNGNIEMFINKNKINPSRTISSGHVCSRD